MKSTIPVAILFMVALAGCTEPISNEESGEVAIFTGEPASDLEGRIDPAPDNLTGTSHVLTGWVNQEAMVGVQVNHAGDIKVDKYARFAANGTWALPIDISLGHNEVWIRFYELDGDNPMSIFGSVVSHAVATVTIDYGSTSERDLVESTVYVDINPPWYASAQAYREHDASHPDFVNIHDVLVLWDEQTENDVEFGFSERYDAFSVERINGEGNPIDSAAPPWWCYTINESGDGVQGITLQRFEPGDSIEWTLGACGQAVTGA